MDADVWQAWLFTDSKEWAHKALERHVLVVSDVEVVMRVKHQVMLVKGVKRYVKLTEES